MRASLILALALAAAPAAAQERFVLPSGLEVTLHEIRWDDEAEAGRFRFVAPAIAEPDFDTGPVLGDLAIACRDFALPVQRALRPGWSAAVLSVSSEPLDFGASAPDVVQFFEAFTFEGEVCIWSEF